MRVVVLERCFKLIDSRRINEDSIAFPVIVFIVAVAFLAWFILGGYATPGT
ncbi:MULTISPECIES: YoaK family small membrane protein [Klebsiella pneumoniae complex]|uniref:YoaK family small membrane protein n=1 Tax=Klebsiella pneumoniae complex TaxID=3390273 RepID=UPI0012998740|nr:YoaK family small membrane protein [Klebsiella variicola]HBR5982991.1 YoaK family small membrane protein [Klebsiella pneumoniae]HCB0987229.1 YoaK family small membrane protein [Klebsiella variicola subsp. variicola]HDS6156568.1 YoaK family small membrane protein [Klebsiella pneumoniae subsp. pneumoniae]HBR6700903.1 YoaK family small membrane protein [Klebsiella pneumoniae]